jgi:hypothetical protein
MRPDASVALVHVEAFMPGPWTNVTVTEAPLDVRVQLVMIGICGAGGNVGGTGAVVVLVSA